MMISIPNRSSMATKKSSTIGANVISHGPYIHHWNAENNTQKERNSRGILINLKVHTGKQLEEE
jgi:hypothetical protein